MESKRKGIAFDVIGMFILGLIGLTILLLLITDMGNTATDIFCRTYEKLADPPAFCEKVTCSSERVYINENSIEGLAREIAAYSVACYTHKAGCLQEENILLCYALIIENHPGEVSEFNVTELLENEGGCEILENNAIVNGTGDLVSYNGTCGIHDNLEWNVQGNFINDQTIILIEYNLNRNTVKVKA